MTANARQLPVVACLALLAAATLLWSAPAQPGNMSNWPAPLRTLDRLISLPVVLDPPIEGRRAAFFGIAGLATLGAGLSVLWRTRAGRRALPYRAGEDAEPPRGIAILYSLLIVCTLASWLVNGASSLSLGWMLALLAGGAWMAWLGAALSPRSANRITAGALVLVCVATGLSIWHHRALTIAITWPIGSVTAAAFVGAIGAAWAGTLLIGSAAGWLRGDRKSQSAVALALYGMAAAIAVALLWAAARRGAPLAVGAAIAVTLLLWWLVIRRSQRMWAAAGVVVLAILIGGGLYIRQQLRGERRTSILYRFLIYRDSLELVRERPFLGHGPDSFAAAMTTYVAGPGRDLRTMFGADVNNAAHNEWLQAATELGVVGALLYVALPLAVLWRAWRRFAIEPERSVRVTIAGASAALLALMFTETTSVMLRSAIGQPWYWTLLGLLLALGRVPRRPPHVRGDSASAQRSLTVGTSWAALRVVVGALLCIATVVDLRSAREHAIGLSMRAEGPVAMLPHLEAALPQFECVEWLRTHREYANVCTLIAWAARDAEATGQPSPISGMTPKEAGRHAAEAWRDVYRACPALPETGAQFADALILADDRRAAEAMLRDHIARVAPYDPSANFRLARNFDTDWQAKRDDVLRALVGGRLEGDGDAILRGIKSQLDVDSRWTIRVAAAMTGPPERESWAEPFAPEVLRVEVWRLASDGKFADARRVAERAVELHRATYLTPAQRSFSAWSEAWLLLARMIWAADLREYRNAYDAAYEAEVMGIRSGGGIVRGTSLTEYLGDAVIPREFPASMQSTYALSAMLHLATGRTKYLAQRVWGALPPEQRTQDRVQQTIADLALQLHREFAALPASDRPENYSTYWPLARSYYTQLPEHPPPPTSPAGAATPAPTTEPSTRPTTAP